MTNETKPIEEKAPKAPCKACADGSIEWQDLCEACYKILVK
jgi:hypothetical protein